MHRVMIVCNGFPSAWVSSSISSLFWGRQDLPGLPPLYPASMRAPANDGRALPRHRATVREAAKRAYLAILPRRAFFAGPINGQQRTAVAGRYQLSIDVSSLPRSAGDGQRPTTTLERRGQHLSAFTFTFRRGCIGLPSATARPL
jgi:hypothetical protein